MISTKMHCAGYEDAFLHRHSAVHLYRRHQMNVND
jgi:hypothetical protein